MSIIVYSKPACTYCDKAKALLKRLGHQYTEKVVTKDISLEELFEEIGKQVRTIPQIVIDGNHIGGQRRARPHSLTKRLFRVRGFPRPTGRRRGEMLQCRRD